MDRLQHRNEKRNQVGELVAIKVMRRLGKIKGGTRNCSPFFAGGDEFEVVHCHTKGTFGKN